MGKAPNDKYKNYSKHPRMAELIVPLSKKLGIESSIIN